MPIENEGYQVTAIKKIVTTIIILCLVGGLLFFGYQAELKLNEYRTALDIHTKRTLEVRNGRNVDFDKLLSQNGDVKGWIWLPDSNIDYPIVQSEDNEYYLHRDLDGNYLYDGSIFIDCFNEAPFEDFNTVIYGHRMISGAMFADLKHYADQKYMDNHRIIQIETPEKSYDLHVVAFCNELSDSDLYTTNFIEWQMPVSDDPDYTADDSDIYIPMNREAFVDLVREKAAVLSGEDFDTDDTFVTLSTCVNASGDQRIQVIGILKDAALEENVSVTKTDKPFINKWLVLQILVGVLIAAAIVATLVPWAKRKRR